MKYKLIILAVTLLIAVVITVSASGEIKQENETIGANKSGLNRKSLKLPRIFDFKRFKGFFKKTYKSFVEELAREKIFLARAFNAFISMCSYKHFKRETYYKVHEMSDWTEAEIQSIYNNQLENQHVPRTSKTVADTPALNLREIKSALEEVAADESNPAAREITEELTGKHRRKRNTDSRADILIDDLLEEPKNERAKNDVGTSLNGHVLSFVDGKIIITKANTGAKLIDKVFSSLFSSSDSDNKHLDGPDEILIDHRRSNCLQEPKNQGNCASCYLFATLSLYEYQYCMENGGKRISFSEQYPLDCGERSRMAGCRGGNQVVVARFVEQYGLELSEHYPYRQRSDVCPYDEADIEDEKMGLIRVGNDLSSSMRIVYFEDYDEKLKDGPLIVNVGVPEDFFQYGGGIDEGTTCDIVRPHAMVIVGSGKQNGIEYWILRNSFGPSWGEDGHWRLRKSAENCWLRKKIGFNLKSYDDKVFKEGTNPEYNNSFITKRKADYEAGRTIKPNPVTFFMNSDLDGAVVPK